MPAQCTAFERRVQRGRHATLRRPKAPDAVVCEPKTVLYVGSTGSARRNHGSQVTETPFVRLKVEAVQNAAALRYQT